VNQKTQIQGKEMTGSSRLLSGTDAKKIVRQETLELRDGERGGGVGMPGSNRVYVNCTDMDFVVGKRAFSW